MTHQATAEQVVISLTHGVRKFIRLIKKQKLN